jgi:4-amino-4-deoxy-L-arabinose transferase-like glycosyltransferase
MLSAPDIRTPPWPTPSRRAERLLLAAVLLLAGALYGWQAAHAQFHGFYATAVKSMTLSWKAFVYGALDPAGSITIDKIPGFLWPQALSARVFGFHPWALALPQAVGGLLAIYVLHLTVRRWAGPTAGLLAAVILALTPVAASVFGKTLEDAALTVMLVFAAYAATRAVESGRLRYLLLTGLWVGLAFQAKMLQSWAVLPAFALVYLVAAPGTPARRLLHVLAAGAATVAVSFSWMLLTTVTPAQDRPYIDGSTNNNAFAMVIGYNGLARFSQVGLTAAGTGSVAATQGGAFGRTGMNGVGGANGPVGPGAGAAGRPETAVGAATAGAGAGLSALPHPRGNAGTDGWTKLIRYPLASQVGWLYPLAALAVLTGFWWRRGRPRTDPVRAGYLLWTGWLLTTALGLSAGNVAHSTYVVALAPALAALAAAGLSGNLTEWRTPTTPGRAWALPVALALTAAWSAHLAAHYPAFLPWLIPATLGVAALATAALVVIALPSRTTSSWAIASGTPARRARALIPSLALTATVVALLAPSAGWSLSVFDSAYDGTSGNASAGPYSSGYVFPAASTRAAASHLNPFEPPTTLDPAQRELVAYLTAHRSGSKYLLATESWGVAAPYIMVDSAPVLPMGGFSGKADFPTPGQFNALVQAHRDQYVLLSAPTMMMRGQPGPDLQDIAAAVTKHCALVPADSYGGVAGETAPLYHCGTIS